MTPTQIAAAPAPLGSTASDAKKIAISDDEKLEADASGKDFETHIEGDLVLVQSFLKAVA